MREVKLKKWPEAKTHGEVQFQRVLTTLSQTKNPIIQIYLGTFLQPMDFPDSLICLIKLHLELWKG